MFKYVWWTPSNRFRALKVQISQNIGVRKKSACTYRTAVLMSFAADLGPIWGSIGSLELGLLGFLHSQLGSVTIATFCF